MSELWVSYNERGAKLTARWTRFSETDFGGGAVKERGGSGRGGFSSRLIWVLVDVWIAA